MKNHVLTLPKEIIEVHRQIFKDLLNCRAIMVEGFGKSLDISFDLETKSGDQWSDIYCYTVNVIDENDNTFRICLIELATFITDKGTFSVNIDTNIGYYFNVSSKNFKVVIDANYFCKEELLKSKINSLRINGKRIYPSLGASIRSSTIIATMPTEEHLYLYSSASLNLLPVKNNNMDNYIKVRERIHNEYYMQSINIVDYLNIIDPQIKCKHFTDAIADIISSVKSIQPSPPMQHKHPTFNKETTIMQTPTIAATFPPVTYSVTTGFLALPDNVVDVDFKKLLESFTDEHALDFLGNSSIIFDQIGAYVGMVRDEKLVHPSIKALSKVVTFTFCRECLNDYTILAVEYLNNEYKSLTGVDYDFINIASSHSEGKEEPVKAFVKNYKRNPGTLPTSIPKALSKTKASKVKVEEVINIYNSDITGYIYGKHIIARRIHETANEAANRTPAKFKHYVSSLFDNGTSDKLMAIYRKSI